MVGTCLRKCHSSLCQKRSPGWPVERTVPFRHSLLYIYIQEEEEEEQEEQEEQEQEQEQEQEEQQEETVN